eukprot:scaffold19407_cov29-Prasinocladus_malaysianus.AAC.1
MSGNALATSILWRRAAHQVPTNSLHLKHDVFSCDARLSCFLVCNDVRTFHHNKLVFATDGGPADEMLKQRNRQLVFIGNAL